MSNEFEPNLEPSERSALEQSLAALQPSAPVIDRDRLMFLAGVASARSQESGDTSQGTGGSGQEIVDRGRNGLTPTITSTPYSVLSTQYQSKSLIQNSKSVSRHRESNIGKSRILWPAAAICLAATSLALAAALILRPEPAARIVYRDRPIDTRSVALIRPESVHSVDAALLANNKAVAPVGAIPADNYVRQRDIALEHGLDALGTTYATGGQAPSPLTYGDWLSTSTPLGGAVEKPIRRPFDL